MTEPPARGAWETVPYAPAHRPGVLRLMAEVQGHATSAEEFIWYFERNPATAPNIYLAIHGGKIVGVSCHNAFRLWLDGAERLVSFPLNVLTDAAYRGQGIFSRLESANEEHAQRNGVSLMLSFPNRQSTPIFVGKLGWREMRGPAYLVHPLRIDRVLALRAPAWLASLGRAGNPLAARLRGGLGGLALARFDRFDDTSDALFRRVRTRWGMCFARGAEYLNWRYVGVPGKDYRCYQVRRAGEALGYLVLGVTEKLGLRLGFVADALLDDDSAYGALQAWAVRLLADEGVDACLQLEDRRIAPGLRSLQNGFVRTPKRLIWIRKGGDAPDDSLADLSSWTFQLGDLDFF
jgi:GNAT superfamily N-acetyltransferase